MISCRELSIHKGGLNFIVMIILAIMPSLSSASALPDILFQKKGVVYIVSDDINLNGDTLVFHSGSKLRFKGGAIYNGVVVFDSTIIENRPKFRNCSYHGNIIIKKLDDRDFTSSDDLGTLRFLLKNAINLGVRCEIHRDYTISMKDVPSNIGILSFRDISSGADIYFNHHTISNTYPFPPHQIKPVLRFLNVKNVTIRDCNFHDTDKNNTHLFDKSTGCSFLQCSGDCEKINLFNCYQENGDCFLRTDNNAPEKIPTRGISDSFLKIKSRNSGYGLALSCGDNLKIDVETDSPHRGLYCAGVRNSTIKYKGINPIETRTHILLKDARYRCTDDNGNEIQDMRGCSNLSIKANVPVLNPNEQILVLSSYGSGLKEGADFRFRKHKCHHQNIDFTACINEYPTDGYYIICNIVSDSGALDENDMMGCKVTGLRIHDIQHIRGQARRYMGIIESHTDVDMIIENCFAENKEIYGQSAYDFQIKGTATGTIILNNSQCGNVLVREKTSGNFFIEGKGKTHFTGGLSYIADGSDKYLVKILQ